MIHQKITFPEGTTLAQALVRLKENGNIRNSLSGTDDAELANLTGRDNSEGLFLADTYRYHGGTRDLDILVMAKTKPQEFIALATDDNVQLRNLGIKAVEANIIKLSPVVASNLKRPPALVAVVPEMCS